MKGKLFVVATPIGNLGDITLRAIDTLKEVDLIACEDTRVTSKLLAKFEIKKELISYHQHSNNSKIDKIINILNSGNSVAVVSDAGTPGLSDPGTKLLKKAYEQDIKVVAIPGVSTIATILSVADLNLHEFLFAGFLPNKKGRQTKLKEITSSSIPVILFESVYRIKKLLGEIYNLSGDRNVIIGRELTKAFETVYRGKISRVGGEIIEKGEFVLILDVKND